MRVTAGSPLCGDGTLLVLLFLQMRIKSLADSSSFNSFFVMFLVIFASGDNLQECDRLGRRKKRETQKLNIKTAGWAAIGWPSKSRPVQSITTAWGRRERCRECVSLAFMLLLPLSRLARSYSSGKFCLFSLLIHLPSVPRPVSVLLKHSLPS